MATGHNAPCPLLPVIERPLTAADSRALQNERGEGFYHFCLRYAQSKWMGGLPAQALLQLNRAMSADLDGSEPILLEYPIPYRQVAWILDQRPDREGQFLANPRRHWQHYATRMSGPRSELRTWRAWACFTIASRLLPHADFPRDERQIEAEGIDIPDEVRIGRELGRHGLPDEVVHWQSALGRGEPYA